MKKKSPMGIRTDTLLNPKDNQPGGVQIVGRMIALLDHYGIRGGLGDRDTVWWLAFMLTRDHVVRLTPTHRPPKKRAPHRPYDLAVGLRDLHTHIELNRARREGRSVRKAADELAKRWRKEGISNWSGNSLRQRYYKIRRRGGATKGMIMAAIKEEKSRSTSKS